MIMSQFYTTHIHTTCLHKINVNIILPPSPQASKRVLSKDFVDSMWDDKCFLEWIIRSISRIYLFPKFKWTVWEKIHTHAHAHTDTHSHNTYTHTCVHTYMHTYIHRYNTIMHTYTHARACAHAHTHTPTHRYMLSLFSKNNS